MRKLHRQKVEGPNPLRQVYGHVPFWRVFKNVLVILAARYIPFFELKNRIYRAFLGMEVGKDTSIAFMVMPDILYPELIRIGENCVIGYHTTLLAHEYLVGEYRTGPVVIGNGVTIGANVTVLPGVTIGDGAVVAAGAVVHRDVAPHTMVGGIPLRVIRPTPQEESL